MKQNIQVYFYLHPYFWPKGDIPEDADTNWPGFGFGPYTWTLQTYLRLKKNGFPCHLVSTVPLSGILIAHRESLSAIDGFFKEKVYPTKNLYVVDISADLDFYSYANFHIVQNPYQTTLQTDSFFMPHWPQPALIKRDALRGDRFENIAYCGNQKNLHPELRSKDWKMALEENNFKWSSKYQHFDHLNPDTYFTNSDWNDFSDVDCLIAVRNFQKTKKNRFNHKPASKLYNAWLAGVPAILGKESAYHYLKTNEFDYLEADSTHEVLKQLLMLKTNLSLRKRIIANGLVRAREIEAGVTLKKWVDLIHNVLMPRYERWISKNRVQQFFTLRVSQIEYQTNKLRNKFSR